MCFALCIIYRHPKGDSKVPKDKFKIILKYFLFKFLFYVEGLFFACMYMYVPCVYSAWEDQKRVSDLLELEFKIAGAGNQTWGLWKTSKCSRWLKHHHYILKEWQKKCFCHCLNWLSWGWGLIVNTDILQSGVCRKADKIFKSVCCKWIIPLIRSLVCSVWNSATTPRSGSFYTKQKPFTISVKFRNIYNHNEWVLPLRNLLF